MLIKIIILVLFAGLLISLSTGFAFLLKDQGNESKRTAYALGVRVTLAAALLATIGYGFATGQLKSKAPWDKTLYPEQSAYSTPNQTTADQASE